MKSNLLYPSLTAAIGLLATVVSWQITRKYSHSLECERFNRRVETTLAKIEGDLRYYESVLDGASGLYAASKSVERTEFSQFVKSLRLSERYLGIAALQFVASVPGDTLGVFEAATAADGMPGFKVMPAGPRAHYMPITYIEPADHQNLVGWDHGVDSVRREVAERACDGAEAVISPRVKLYLGRGDELGFLMFQPIYRNGEKRGDVAQRRAALEGWVVAAFRATDFMRGVSQDADIDFEVFDGATQSMETLLHDNDDHLKSTNQPLTGQDADFASRTFSRTVSIPVYGRRWTVRFSTKPLFDAQASTSSAWMVLMGGGIISVLLFSITLSLNTTRERALLIAEDMTRTLRESEERFRNSFDHAAIGMALVGTDGRWLKVNKSLLNIVGYTEEEMLANDFQSITHPEDLGADLAQVDQLLTGAIQHYEMEKRCLHKNGTIVWIMLSASLVRDHAGAPLHLIAQIQDISVRKRTEDALKAAKQAADAANVAKSEFLANMSHELRTPLNSVIGFSSILIKNKAGNLRESDILQLERIQQNGKHLLKLINSVLDLSKVEAGKVELELSPLNPIDLINETIAQLGGQVHGRSVRLVAEVPPGAALLHSDSQRLKQVIINLVANALKFTEQGSVTVRLRTDPLTQQPIAIDVIDTGIGIPAEKLALVFEAFQQADNSTARKYGGTGLGLTISRSLCELMGYRLDVTSELGKGSTFTINLQPKGVPASAHAQSTCATIGAAMADVVTEIVSELKGKRVLVIDDDLEARMLLLNYLRDAGCTVFSAASGQEGLSAAREYQPDVITLDYYMPRMNGWAVLKELKADPGLCSIPVVVVSMAAEENRGALLGAVDFLAKPVERDDLLKVLVRSIGSTKTRALVIDDDDDSRRLICTILEEEGVHATTAANGMVALEKMKDFQPDIILVDLMMPVMDGISFLERIQSMRRTSSAPLAVVVTAKDLSFPETCCIERNAAALIHKGEALAENLKTILSTIVSRTQ